MTNKKNMQKQDNSKSRAAFLYLAGMAEMASVGTVLLGTVSDNGWLIGSGMAAMVLFAWDGINQGKEYVDLIKKKNRSIDGMKKEIIKLRKQLHMQQRQH